MTELYLSHHGILGQRWGVRRFQNKDGTRTAAGKKRYIINRTSLDGAEVVTKSGQKLTIRQDELSAVARFNYKHSKKVRDLIERSYNFELLDSKNKKIGDMQLFSESKDELNGVWLGVNRKQRGQGYADAALSEAIKFAKEQGYSKFTLEVPGDSPDARHIYEKHGFVATKTLSEDDVWGGLTAMELKLK